MTLAVIVVYLLLVLGIGAASHRMLRSTGEDYFVASRSIGSFVLLMSLFGTHMTAFSMLGAAGEAYHVGVGVFSLMASSSALVVPVVFFFVGRRLWVLGKRYGYLTQIQFFRDRWGSDGLAMVLLVVLVALLIPYLLIGVMGAGITVELMTGGQVPGWLGSLVICMVVMTYVVSGGARGTAWANTFQTLVFMGLGGLAFFVIVRDGGGLAGYLAKVDPTLLSNAAHIPGAKLLTYTLIPLSVGMFPHIFMHWLTAKREESFRLATVAYPLCIAAVWLPSVLLGVLGTVDFPGLEGPAANTVLVRMIDLHAPGLLAGLLAAGVFAAVMSSLDSQVLSLSTLFTQDVVRRHRVGGRMSDRRQVHVARLIAAGILAFTFGLSLVTDRSIFRLGIWSFSGYAALFPLVVAALFWRRSNRQGAMASVLVTAALWVVLFVRGGDIPGYTLGDSGIMPVAALIAVSTIALVVVSLLTPPPPRELVDRFFPRPAGELVEEPVDASGFGTDVPRRDSRVARSD